MGEDDTWEAILAVDASGISFVLGLKGNGVKLRRGFAPPDSAHPTQVFESFQLQVSWDQKIALLLALEGLTVAEEFAHPLSLMSY